MNIHDELQRLILRRRWIAWADREWKRVGPKNPNRTQCRLLVLAGRLAGWKPTWEQRWDRKRNFDGAIP